MCIVCVFICLAFTWKFTAQQLQRRPRLASHHDYSEQLRSNPTRMHENIIAVIHQHFRVNGRHSYPSTQLRTSVQWHEQWRTTFLNSHRYSNNNDTLISNSVTDFFLGPKVETFTDNQQCIFVSSVIVRCGRDQFGAYMRRIFVGSSSIPVIGDNLFFFRYQWHHGYKPFPSSGS
jgi:hypothetical protein